MNQDLQKILDMVKSSGTVSEDIRKEIADAVKAVDYQLSVTEFKLERMEKIKKTTAIFLEETIEELEQKRKAVEEQAKLIQAENERKTKELEEARQIQLAMLPKELPQLPNLDIAVYMETATEVGGDYYDFHVGMDGTLTVGLGDATGHGMKAGTMVTIAKSLFNSLASEDCISSTFTKMSQVIKDMKLRQLSMCLMLLKINGDKMSVSSAAIPPAYLYRDNTHTVEEIFLEGMPLGAMKDFSYPIKEYSLNPDDTIIMLSDGLPELLNNNEEMYGYERIKSEFLSVAELNPEAIVEHFRDSATQWADGRDADDDVTFVVLKIK